MGQTPKVWQHTNFCKKLGIRKVLITFNTSFEPSKMCLSKVNKTHVKKVCFNQRTVTNNYYLVWIKNEIVLNKFLLCWDKNDGGRWNPHYCNKQTSNRSLVQIILGYFSNTSSLPLATCVYLLLYIYIYWSPIIPCHSLNRPTESAG
jgi:hypothetical protein